MEKVLGDAPPDRCIVYLDNFKGALVKAQPKEMSHVRWESSFLGPVISVEEISTGQ